jgi:hypothetical protein
MRATTKVHKGNEGGGGGMHGRVRNQRGLQIGEEHKIAIVLQINSFIFLCAGCQ